jgi:uncharacterized protein (TIGR03067 family)
VGALTVAVARETTAAEDVPPRLTEAASRAVLAFTGGSGEAGAVSSSVSALTTEYLQSRSRLSRFRSTRFRLAIAVLVATCLLLVLLFRQPVLALLGIGGPAVAAQRDQQQIQGSWVASRVQIGGIDVPPNDLRLAFAGEQFTLSSVNLGLRIMGSVRLDATRSPPEITLLPEQGGEWPGI